MRERLGLSRPTSSREWLIAEDNGAFESAYGPLSSVVPERFARLAVGRLCDMDLGPRGAA